MKTGVSTSLRRLFAKNRDNECNRDVSTSGGLMPLTNSVRCLEFGAIGGIIAIGTDLEVLQLELHFHTNFAVDG
jgi:hypothetical protein